jgi:hypothetical protein
MATVSGRSHRQRPASRCSICNNLDPRGHAYSRQDEKSGGASGKRKLPQWSTALSLPIDSRRLARLTASNCRFCRLLADVVQAFWPSWLDKRPSITLNTGWNTPLRVSLVGQEGIQKLVEIFCSRGKLSAIDQGRTTAGAMSLTFPECSTPPWPALGSSRDIPQSSDSDDSYSFVKQCLDACESNQRHVRCRNHNPSNPTRLIDLRGKTPRLCIAPPEPVSYIALSHCWGKDVPITTTKTTLRKRLRSIDIEELPPLFQDAVTIARRLQVNFLWIDSLCIVQDDAIDWQRESARMAAVYSSAHLTIAAAAASDGHEHCLKTRESPMSLSYSNTKGKTFELKARQVADHHPHSDDKDPPLIGGPLSTRAWALQEHMLSSRILHYAASELVFECRAAWGCECRPSLRTWPTTPGILSRMMATGRNDLKYDMWHRTVEKYTLRRLSHQSDKLPAASGMAMKFGAALKSTYLAGLWTENILGDLLWSSAPFLEHPHAAMMVEPYRAPAFSWASVDTQIHYELTLNAEEPKVEYIATVTDMECDLSTLNPFGEIKSSTLSIRGPVQDGTLVGPENYSFYYSLKLAASNNINVFPDCCIVMDESGSARVRRCRRGEEYRPFSAPVVCLGVASSPLGIVSGLVLAPSSRKPGAFERLGLFSCGVESFSQDHVREILLD